MDLATTRVPTARLPWRQLGVLALIAVLIAGALAVASSRRSLPAPFGVAADGLVAYVDRRGDIVVADTAGVTVVEISGRRLERPSFSPDGTQLAFLRAGPRGLLEVVVVAADGSGERVVSRDPFVSVGYFGWSPDSSAVVVGARDRITLLDRAGRLDPVILADSDGTPVTVPDDGFNSDLSDLFRPPAGDQVLFVADHDGSPTLDVIDRTTGSVTTILDGATSSVAFSEVGAPQWSPNGAMIAVTLFDVDHGDYLVYVMNADGSGLRPLSDVKGSAGGSEANSAWSPSGSHIAIQRWFNGETVDVRPITIVDVANGTELETEMLSLNGYVGFAWSPSGNELLVVPDDRREVGIIDAITGTVRYPGWQTTDAPSWQRVAPPD